MSRYSVSIALAVVLWCVPQCTQAASVTEPPASDKQATTYDDHLVQANVLFKQGKLDEALAAAQTAQKLDPKRYEAPATAALILHAAKKTAEAKAALDEAIKLAPPDKQDKVQKIAKLLAAEPTAPAETAATAVATPAGPPQLTVAARRQLDALTLITEEADKATLDTERKKLLREFMGKSAEFIVDHPFQTNVWVLRAAVALELDYPGSGWLAGKRLKAFGVDESDDPKTRKIMAMLDRKGWLGDKTPNKQVYYQTTEQTRQAAEDGAEDLQNALGNCYLNGSSGFPKDAVEAVRWYRKAAEQGEACAQSNLGYMYANGNGVPKDTTEAVKWYRKAAEQGEAYAQNGLAWALATSPDGAIRNGKEAVQWATKACESAKWTNIFNIGTLAAAHAEAGDFGDAVKYAKMAIKNADPAKDADFIKGAEDRLKLYKDRQPYREQ